MQVSDTSEKCSCVPPSNAGNASLPPMDVVAVTDHENVASVAPVRPTDAASVPLRLHGYSMQEDEELMPKLDEHASDVSASNDVVPLLSRSENLCVRHQRMADEGANARLQKVRLFDPPPSHNVCTQFFHTRMHRPQLAVSSVAVCC